MARFIPPWLDAGGPAAPVDLSMYIPTLVANPATGKPPEVDTSFGGMFGRLAEGQPDLGPLPKPQEPDAPVKPNVLGPDMMKILAGLAGKDNSVQYNLGNAGLPAQIAAPVFSAPDYRQAEAEYAKATPHPISAPQYVQPNYAASDALWEQAKPTGPTQEEYDNDKWGRITAGAASSILSADNHRLLAGIIGGLGGYGTALQNRTKMDRDTADRTSTYLLNKAGYTQRKIQDVAQGQNTQLTANYQAERSNANSLEDYYRAHANFLEGKAGVLADVANKNKQFGYNADVRNADIRGQRGGIKILGQKGGMLTYSKIDDKGNLIVESKPLADFNAANRNAQGRMAGGDVQAMAGLETLIQTVRGQGGLRQMLGDQYDALTSPERDYGTGGRYSTLSDIGGEKGKAEAWTRTIGEENAAIAQHLMTHPALLQSWINSIQGMPKDQPQLTQEPQ